MSKTITIALSSLLILACASQSEIQNSNETAIKSTEMETQIEDMWSPNAVSSIDLVTYQINREGKWFSTSIDSLPSTQQKSTATYDINATAIKNRRNGDIAATLAAGYLFLQQGEVTLKLFDEYAHTINALFIRSGKFSFMDYNNNRVLSWGRKAIEIPIDIFGLIKECNKRQIPVFLELNFSDYVPGPLGSGIESLQKANNIKETLRYLKTLRAQNLHIAGMTFGNEIEDDIGFGKLKPTVHNSDLIGKFIDFAHEIKTEYPQLKLYAFDSYIGATRGKVLMFWPYLQKVREAERKYGIELIDGFVFHESYTYINDKGRLMDSQGILDDTESLYRKTKVFRYDVTGINHENTDRDYLHQIKSRTERIFGRDIFIGLNEYLPAGPIQINETDTSSYLDIDFILHYCDVIAIYAELGLDTVSKMMFGYSLDMHKASLDCAGNRGVNYPIHEQIALHLKGVMLNVNHSIGYDRLKTKVYAAYCNKQYFIMILNKDVEKEATILVKICKNYALTIRLPKHSYTSLIVNGNDIIVSGIGK